jgi:methionyl aminopeptidase
MSIKHPSDWAGLREVARIVRLMLDELAARVEPGVTTADLDRAAAQILADHHARSAPTLTYNFPGSALISINDEVVHGVPGPRRIRRGDLVSLDVTVEKDGYVADAARSVVVDGGEDLARRLVACAESALDAALEVARDGMPVNGIGRAVERVVGRAGFHVVRGLSGHGVGRAIHEWPDVPNQYDPHQADVLTEGLVLTIEPMIAAGSGRTFVAKDGWTVKTRDGSWASHHEHTLVITKGAPVILTASAA